MSGRVLLVDDERDTRELLGRALERAGYECVLAANADKALALVSASERWDVIVTDVVLGLDDRRGLRLLGELRRHGLRAPVVVITAYADLEKVKCALNEGADYLLEKPFRAAELVEAIERVRAQASSSIGLEGLFERVHLTEKERTVARHLLAGLSSGEIAALERNSPKTIRQHVSQIYAKCEVGSRAEFFRRVYAR
jgi:DNA-binding NarL/FixJ family response regulator